MFDVDLLFLKDSPLYKIWLIAHFGKKFIKPCINNIQIIDDSIKELLLPEIKLAIRVCGYLLYGIVKLYFEQLCFILNECNIKNEDKLNTSQIAIYKETKPIKNPKKRKLNSSLINKTHIENITLKDESLPILLLHDDNISIAKIPRFEEEVMRSFMGGVEESVYEISKLSATTHNKTAQNLQQTTHSKINTTFDLPELELPPIKHLDNDIKSKKRSTHVIDENTMIDKDTMKLYLNDASPITKILKSNINDNNEILNIINKFSFGKTSVLLEKLSYNTNKQSTSINVDSIDNLSIIEPIGGLSNELNHMSNELNHTKLMRSTNSFEYNLNDTILTIDKNNTLNELTTFLSNNLSTSFNDFTIHDKKNKACRKFIDLLHLYKASALDITQNEPYGDIYISGIIK